MSNSTPGLSSSFEIVRICRSLGELKDPSKATSASLAASLSAIVATALTLPFAAILNGLVLLAFYKNPSLRRQSHVFLMSLALIDLVRIILASPFYLFKEVFYQKMLEPNCFVMASFMNFSLSASSDMILTAMNCERFIGLKYPIWHRVNVTKCGLYKIAFACFMVGATLTLVRTFIEIAQIVNLLFFVCTSFATLTFAVLIWWVIKKRNQSARTQSGSRDFLAYHSSDRESAAQKYIDEELPPLKVFHVIQQEANPKQTFEVRAGIQRQKNAHNIPKDINSVKNSTEESDVCSDKVKGTENHQIAKQQTVLQPARVASRTNLFSKCERKAGQIAIYLTIGILFSRIIPILLVSFMFNKTNIINVLEPLVQYLSLITTLTNPLIYMGTNQQIRKSCLKF